MASGRKRYGFKRDRRLVRAEDFRRVLKTGRRDNRRYFSFYSRQGASPVARLGVAVGKRYVRNATARNRLKRVIRETFRHHAARLPAVDFVVVVRQAATAAAPKELVACLDDYFAAAERHDG